MITTIGAEQLEQSGAGNAVEALVSVAQNQPTLTSNTTVGAGSGFASFANLRSLGPSSTLVLFNGRRVATNPFQGVAVDLNTIPLNMIERVETLADGASSVYGSDAIAGVINFITRPEMTGASISVTAFEPEEDGGERRSAAISGGVGNLDEDGWNIFGGYSYHDRAEFSMGQRDFSATSYIPQRGVNRLQNRPLIANWSQAGLAGGTPQNPSAPACLPPASPYANGTFGVNSCAYDFAPATPAFPEQTDQSLLLHGAARLGAHTVTLEYFRSETDIISALAAKPVGNLPMSSSNIYYPGLGSTPCAPASTCPNAANNVLINWRIADTGPLTVGSLTTTDRILAELAGDLGGWAYDVWALRSTSTVELDLVDGYVNDAQFAAALLGVNPSLPDLNPFGPQSAAGAAFLESIALRGNAQNAEAELRSGGAQLSRRIFQLPAGAVQFAIAADYKKELNQFRTTPAAVASTQAVLLTNIDAERESYGFVVETRIPLMSALDLDLSLRYDDYSDFGSTQNPKALITWQPVEQFSLRASYNEGFRAPTLQNVFTPLTLGESRVRFNDPVLCPGGVANVGLGGDVNRDCGGVYRTRGGGNAALEPERSEAYTAGIMLQPTSSLSFGLDYWNYHIQDTIAPLAESAIFGNLALFGDLITRCSTADPALIASIPFCAPGHSGDPIAYVDLTNQNLGETKTDGVDFSARWRSGASKFGSFTIDYRGTAVLDYDYQLLPNGPFFSRAGVYRDGYPVFDYSHYLSLGWDSDPVTVQLSNRYLAGYDDCNASCAIAPAFHQSVDAYSLWELSATLRWTDKARITGRISNVLDTDPPFTNKNVGGGTGWDERFTDPTGRAFSVTLRYEF